MSAAVRSQKSFFAGACVLVFGLVAAAQPSYAGPHGGGGMGMGAGGMGFGGSSAGHFSTQGSLNTNGPNAVDRSRGLDRAQTRMSEQGLENNNAVNQQAGLDRAQTRMSDEGLANSQASAHVDADAGANANSTHRKHKSD